MKELLGAEFPDYLASLDEERARSLRVNTGKWRLSEADDSLGDLLTGPVPWVPEGRYYRPDARPGTMPEYAAGLFYLQEASAMTPGSVLPLAENRPPRVLDLCAAPGGKATQIAARLAGRGVLYANDISASRAQTLLRNLERAGAPRIFVTAERPERLAEEYPESFDSVLVDAPCSGEGMFRKDGAMIRDWIAKGPSFYQPLQRKILESAARLTAPGGWLLYSTCTFSREEDEGNIEDFLNAHGEFELRDIPDRPGFSEGFLPGTVRLWPQRVHAEGHFFALMRKKSAPEAAADAGQGETACRGGMAPDHVGEEGSAEGDWEKDFSDWKKKNGGRNKNNGSRRLSSFRGNRRKSTAGGLRVDSVEVPAEFTDMLPDGIPYVRENKVYLLPAGETPRGGLRYLRTGLLLGETRSGRFLPSQALAMAAPRGAFPDRVDLGRDGAVRYLRGETVSTDGADVKGEEGIVLVTMGGFPLGWARRQKNRLRNMLNPGWRQQ